MSHAPEAEEYVPAVPVADLSEVDLALSRGDEVALKAAVLKARPADLGFDLSRRPVEQGRRILLALDDRRASAMLQAAHPAIAAKLVAGIEPARAARALLFMPTEREAAILAAMPAAARTGLEAALDPDDKRNIEKMLGFDEAAIGRMVTPMIWRAAETATVGEALDTLRDHSGDIEVGQNCYVVTNGLLVGVAALREIAILPREKKLADVMTRNPIAVIETSSRADAAEIVRRHDFLSLPVTDKAGQLVGAVRVDDILDAAMDKLGAGILNQGGVAGKVAAKLPYFQTRIHTVVRSRLTWLILLFVAETATGTVLRYFEDELAKVVALSFFIPLLIGTGGNAGSQTVSTIIRALALGEVRRSDVLRVVWKEVSAGLILGILLGAIAFGRALLWGVHADLAMCVGVTVLVVCTWANAVGAMVPLAAEKLGIDPTVISAPLITTLVDASGLFIYFSVAHLMIAQLHGG